MTHSTSLRSAQGKLRVGSLFSGVGGMDAGFHAAGFETAWFVENDRDCRSVLARHWPAVPCYGDIREVDGGKLAPVDAIVGGFPCFPPGTTVLCRDGLKDIAEVGEGDEVLTHLGRWRRVTACMTRTAPTWLLRGHGHPSMITTAEHPFWSVATDRRWVNERRGWERLASEPTWADASAMQGRFWASPCEFPEASLPPIETTGRERLTITDTTALLWVVGAWLGDGWLNLRQRPHRPDGQLFGQTLICVPKHGEAYGTLTQTLDRAGLPYSTAEQRTTIRVIVSRRALALWLVQHFGQYAAGKTVPAWALGLPRHLRQALLDGYVWADGSTLPTGFKTTTVSRRLAIGVKLLAQSLGYSVALHRNDPPPTKVIEGRTVSQRPWWQLVALDHGRSSMLIGSHRFGLVRSSAATGRVETVHNIEVEEDNSYIADGLAVHNCQDLSVAGKREGLGGARSGLYWEAVRIVREMRATTSNRFPAFVVLENVPGLLSSGDGTNRGRDFAAVLGGLRELGAAVGYRILDARFFSVPQRRRRVFIVAGFAGEHPGAERVSEILSLVPSSSRHPETSGAERQGAARDAAAGAGGVGPQGRPTIDYVDGVADTVRSHPRPGSNSVGNLAYTLRGNTNGTGASDNGQDATYIPALSVPLNAGAHPGSYNGQDATNDLLIPVANSVTASAGHHGYTPDRGDGSSNLILSNNREPHVNEEGIAPSVRSGDSRMVIAAPLTAGGHPNSSAPGRHREDDENLVAVPISADAAGGRSGDAETPSPDAEGNIRLRPPSLGVGAAGDPSFTVSAAGPPAVAFDWQKGGGGNDSSWRGKSREWIERAGDYAGSLSATKHDAIAIRIGQQGSNGHGFADDESHALDSGGPVQAVAFHLTQDPINGAESRALGASSATGSVAVAISEPCVEIRQTSPDELMGYTSGIGGQTYAVTEARSREVLCRMRSALGEEAFQGWGLGVYARLYAAEVLHCDVHGPELRCPPEPISGQDDDALPRAETRSARSVLGVLEAIGVGCPPSRRGPYKQLSRELAAALSELPHEAAQAEVLLLALHAASEGLRVLRDALPAVQTVGRSAQTGLPDETAMSRLRRACQCSQSVRAPLHAEETRRHAHVNNSARKEVGGLAVRRLTPRLRECERLQGMPDDHTRWRADGSEIPDGPRYRMVGNSVAVPVLAWIAQRIAPVLAGGPP